MVWINKLSIEAVIILLNLYILFLIYFSWFYFYFYLILFFTSFLVNKEVHDYSHTTLLSLLLPSYTIVLIRELANISCSLVTKALLTKPITSISINMNIDIDNDILRERSKFPLSNSSRDLSTFLQASSVPYY